MIGTIRKCRICTRGGILAAILVAAVFASSQVTCLTHSHCEDADCFDEPEHSHHHTGNAHNDHHDHGYHRDHGCETAPHCDNEHHNPDIHHHSDDSHSHPQRRFIAPSYEMPLLETACGETPAFELTARLPAAEEPPPFERYGPIFAGRAPPLS